MAGCGYEETLERPSFGVRSPLVSGPSQPFPDLFCYDPTIDASELRNPDDRGLGT